MNFILNAIVPLSPVILVALPVIGACFGLGISRVGLEFNRWTAFSNSLVSCLVLATVMLAPLLQSEADYQSTRSLSVIFNLPASETETTTTSVAALKWSLDATSLWFLLLPTCLWPVLTLFLERLPAVSALHYFLLMLLQGFLAGLFVAVDLLSFLTFLMLSTFCLLSLIRVLGGVRVGVTMERTMYLQFAGDALVMAGLLLAATSYTWMQGILLESPQQMTYQLDTILQGTVSDITFYPIAESYWQTASPWIFLLLMTGFVIKGSLIPVHYQFIQWLNLTPTGQIAPPAVGWYLVLLTMLTKVSLYGMIRFMVPLNQGVGTSLFSSLAVWGGGGFLMSALIAGRKNSLLEQGLWLLIGQNTLILTLLFAAETAAVSQFVFWSLIQGAACCLLFLMVPMIPRETDARSRRLFFTIAGLALLTLIGVPGLAGFTADFALLWSLGEQSIPLALCYLLGLLLFNLTLIRSFWKLIQETMSGNSLERETPHEKIGLSWLAFAPLVSLILILGVSPATLLEETLLPLIRVSSTETEAPTEPTTEQ